MDLEKLGFVPQKPKRRVTLSDEIFYGYMVGKGSRSHFP